MTRRERWWHGASAKASKRMVVMYLVLGAANFILGFAVHVLWLVSAVGLGLAASWVPQWRRALYLERHA